MKVVKGLHHVPFEGTLHRQSIFSLFHRLIRRGLIYTDEITYDHLDVPLDTVIVGPTRSGLRSCAFKVRQQQFNTRRRQHTFSVRVVQYWTNLPEQMVNAIAWSTLFSFNAETFCQIIIQIKVLGAVTTTINC